MTTAIDHFLADGFVAVRGAVAPGVVRTCVALIEEELRARGIDPRNRVTWTKPVVRFACPEGPPFAAARHVARALQRVRPAPGPRPLDSAPRRRRNGHDTGRQIDFHVIVLDERGRGLYGPPGTEDHYPPR